MRRFEIQSTLEGSAGEPIGEGVEFGNGVAVVNWARPFSSSVEVFTGGMDALALHVPNADIVWLDKPEALVQPPQEPDTGRHAQPVDFTEVQAIEHLTKDVWDGQPLPDTLTPHEGPLVEMWPPKGEFRYNVNQGGLMRCCLESLDLAMESRNEAGEVSDGSHGDIINCRHCSNSMIRAVGGWKWNQP